MPILKQKLKSFLGIPPKPPKPPRQPRPIRTRYYDITEENFFQLFEYCKPYSKVGLERFYALYKATEYIVKNGVDGDFVECGVWRGGSTLFMAKCLELMGERSRRIFLYDTYEGMTAPSDADVRLATGETADEQLQNAAKVDGDYNSVHSYASLDDVKNTMALTSYPASKIVYVVGPVEQTIPETVPDTIALLRLDTDWYESTRHELIHLYPRLVSNGILIIDDYGTWAGARQATDEYFEEHGLTPLMNRVDAGGRVILKP